MKDLIKPDEACAPQNLTFSGEGTLPRVPLPSVEESLIRFEQWCSPLLDNQDLSTTQAAIAKFSNGPAQALQQTLVDYNDQAGVHSWLDDFWPARYLGRRVPVSINANFVFTFIDRPQNQTQRAAQLIHNAVSYKLALDTQSIPPANIKGTPLCMEQHKYLFSTTRIPGPIRDDVKAPYSTAHPAPPDAKHILVLHKRQFFALTVITENNNPFTQSAIESALQSIINGAPEQPLDKRKAVGYLTTLPRSDWAETRKALIANDNNQSALETIESALFCLCLDSAAPTDLGQATDQLLHGDGGNRWFDKSVSLIVFSNGVAGVNCEHCGVDGSALIELVDYLHDDEIASTSLNDADAQLGEPSVQPILFTLDEDLQTTIEDASKGFDKLASETATRYWSFDDFGANHIKQLKVSPDAFAQIGFQLAHLRTKGLIGATYESVATRHFDRGRTEAMRVVTPEIVAFANAMDDDQIHDQTKSELFRKAAKKHSLRLRECQQGLAPEQHLWQLQLVAQAQGLDTENDSDFSLFRSPGWLTMRNDYLSTSSAPSENITVFGFGATSEQCIGIAYLVRGDSIKAYFSTPAAVADAMEDFADQLQLAFRDLATLMANTE